MAPNTAIRAGSTRSIAALGLLVGALGCAPELLPPADDGATGSTGDVDGTGSDTTGDDAGQADDFSSGGEQTDVPPTGLCLHSTALTTIPESYEPLTVVDNDGDGRDELWAEDSGHDLAVFAPDEVGGVELVAEHVVGGYAHRMEDVDGDGLHDVLMTSSEGGESQGVWSRATPALGLGADLLPLGFTAFNAKTWVDLDGDGAIDFVERLEGEDYFDPGGLRVHMGDGAGGFVPGQELWADFQLFTLRAYDTGIAGRPIFAMEEFESEWGGGRDVIAAQMQPGGQFDVVAQQFPVFLTVVGAGDFDGNGVPDLAGYNAFSSKDVIVVEGQLDGGFEVSVQDASVLGMVVAELDGDAAGEVDLLYWDNDEVWLRRGTAQGFAEPEPVVRTGAGGYMNTAWPMQADGSGGHEVLTRASGVEHRFMLQALRPCD